MTRIDVTSTPWSRMIAMEVSPSTWVWLVSGEGFSVQLRKTAARSS